MKKGIWAMDMLGVMECFYVHAYIHTYIGKKIMKLISESKLTASPSRD